MQQTVFDDEDNKCCVDCREYKSEYLNLTFGVYCCEVCAKKHMAKYDQTTSQMVSLREPLDVYTLSVMKHSSNKLWMELCSKYGLTDKERDPRIVYKSDIGIFKRKQLRAEIYGLKGPSQEPPKTFGQWVDRGFAQIGKSLNDLDRQFEKKPKRKEERVIAEDPSIRHLQNDESVP